MINFNKIIQCCLLLLASQKIVATPRSVYEDQYLWKKQSIRVCWATVEEFKKVVPDLGLKIELEKPEIFNEKIKKIVKEKVQDEFVIEKVGIEFTGWAECSVDHDADIVIMGVNNFVFKKENDKEKSLIVGKANIGTSKEILAGPRIGQGFVFLNKIGNNSQITRNEALLFTALHEFGHAAGLRHEHVRKDALKDKNCKHRFSDEKYRNENNETAKFIGEYDKQSVMNYCYDWFISEKEGIDSRKDIQLSAGDRNTLLCMYSSEKAAAGSCDTKELKIEFP